MNLHTPVEFPSHDLTFSDRGTPVSALTEASPSPGGALQASMGGEEPPVAPDDVSYVSTTQRADPEETGPESPAETEMMEVKEIRPAPGVAVYDDNEMKALAPSSLRIFDDGMLLQHETATSPLSAGDEIPRSNTWEGFLKAGPMAAHTSIDGDSPLVKTEVLGVPTLDSMSTSSDPMHETAERMVTLERSAPHIGFHAWVVCQDPDGHVTTSNLQDFEAVVDYIRPQVLQRIQHRRHHHHVERSLPAKKVWMDLQGLEAKQITELGGMMRIHNLTVEDMVAEDCPEKVETFETEEYQYCVLLGQWPDYSSTTGWGDRKISCLMLRDWFITLHSEPVVGLDEMLRRVRREFVASLRDYDEDNEGVRPLTTRMSGAWLLYGLIDILVDSLIPRTIKILEQANQVDEMSLQLWDAINPEMEDFTRMLTRTRKNINELRRNVVSKEALIKDYRLHEQPQYRDVLDHLVQMLGRLDSARDILAQANSNYLAGISVQAAIDANQTNDVMKKMSLLASVFVPMTLITSLFGMNVQVPWQNVDSTRPFYGILIGFGVLGILCFIYYKWKKRRKGRGLWATLCCRREQPYNSFNG